jgi:NAD(P)H-dependent FMN reductase
MAGQYSRDHTWAWAATVGSYDAFVFVTPEYNHAPPGALKNAIDFLFAEWNDKAAGFVSYGVNGGVRAVEQLRLVMADVRSAVALSVFDDFRDHIEFTPNHTHAQAVNAMLDDLAAMRTVRATKPTG